MSVSEMLERAAKAAYEADVTLPNRLRGWSKTPWEEIHPDNRLNFINQAWAALIAVRDLDDKTLEAGRADDEGGWGAPATLEAHWRLTLDAILSKPAQ